MTAGSPVGTAIDLWGRAALVTGAGAGIGREIARTLAAAGARVAVNDIDVGRAGETVALIVEERSAADATRAGASTAPAPPASAGAAVGATKPPSGGVPGEGPVAVALAGDVTDEGDVAAVVRGTVEAFGALDIAVNNVGMLGGLGPRRVADVDGAYARRVIELNLLSTLLCCAAETRAMTAAGRPGVIVNVSSGETTRAAPGLAVYAAAKAAVNHLTRSLAVELGPSGIRAHAVAPGTTPTDEVRARLSDEHLDAIAASTPLRRPCRPEDLAGLVLLLVSDLASAVTGQLVLADVGAHLSLSRPSIPMGETADDRH